MNINPIKTEADYEQTLAEIDTLFGATPDTPEGDRLEVLVTLVEAYERKHHPVGPPDPIAAIEYHLDSRGLTEHALDEYLGGRSHVIAVLDRRKPLTIEMIRNLYLGLGIPVEILMQSLIREWEQPTYAPTKFPYIPADVSLEEEKPFAEDAEGRKQPAQPARATFPS